MEKEYKDNITKEDSFIITEEIIEALELAQKDYEEGRTYSEEEVWDLIHKKHGFNL